MAKDLIASAENMLYYSNAMESYLNGKDTDIDWVDDSGNLTETGMNLLAIMASYEDRAKEAMKKMKADVQAVMESNSIKGFDSDMVRVTYVAPSERETFDKNKLKADNQELYDKYVKFTPVSASVRVKVK